MTELNGKKTHLPLIDADRLNRVPMALKLSQYPLHKCSTGCRQYLESPWQQNIFERKARYPSSSSWATKRISHIKMNRKIKLPNSTENFKSREKG